MEKKGGVTPKPDRDGMFHDNQRLEHLGDAVLQLVASEFVFHKFPEVVEGQMSSIRAALVNNALICDVAATCGMHHCMRYEQNQFDEPGRARRGMLSDCFEARIPIAPPSGAALTSPCLAGVPRRALPRPPAARRRGGEALLRADALLALDGDDLGPPLDGP